MDYKKIKGLALWGVPALALLLGGMGCGQESSPSQPAPEPEPTAMVEKEAAEIHLRQSKSGSVLILEEPESGKKAPAPDDDSLSGKAAKPLPAGYKAFRDQHVKLYVKDIPAGLDKAVQAAQASSGQVINHPIKGFENMGPNEKTLVFDSRTYPAFLKKLKLLGKVEFPELGPCDYVTVRLTVLKEK
ncbi:MAG: hypothetical protein U9N73_10995 [Candidatus Auribacterota bacterium]|nr:hypothetical protein [Candidatus Auribacterota bacterium]